MSKKTSIQDIANELGVSKALVSYVLNGKGKENRISEEMIKKVFRMAQKLNYRPNQVAHWFRTGKTQTIGVLIPDISSPFFGKLCKEIENEASKYDYKIIVYSSEENPEKSEKQLNLLMKGHVDGFIIAPSIGSNKQIKGIEESGVPYVLVDRYFPEIDSSYVVIDNFTFAQKATQHLIEQGAKQIAFVTANDGLFTMNERKKGYLKALSDSKLAVDDSLICVLKYVHHTDELKKFIKEQKLVNKKLDAVLFANSQICQEGLKVAIDLKLSIPEDIAVVSFDDPDFFEICYAPVTAIAQPITEMGKESFHILKAKLENKYKEKHTKMVLDAKLIVRNSSVK